MSSKRTTGDPMEELKPMSTARKVFLILFVLVVLLISTFLLWVSNNYVVPIMMYHHVGYTDQDKSDFVSPRAFETQMKYLYDHDFKVLSLAQLVEAIKAGKKFYRKSVVITFDDGFKDNYTHAFKILKKYNYSATFFISPDYVGLEEMMDWEEIREMLAHGMEFGSHTRRHTYLPDEPLDVQRDEIINSKKIIEEKLEAKVRFFAYPIGGFNQQIKDIVREGGYEAACTTNRGYDPSNRDVYELNRIRFGEKDARWYNLWMKLSGYYNLLRTLEHPY